MNCWPRSQLFPELVSPLACSSLQRLRAFAKSRHAVVSLLPERTGYVLSFLCSSTLFSASELQACCILLPVIRFASVLLALCPFENGARVLLVAHDPSKTFPLQKLKPRLRSSRSLLLFLQMTADGPHSQLSKELRLNFRAFTPLGESVSFGTRFQVPSDRFFHGLLDTDCAVVSAPKGGPKPACFPNELVPRSARLAPRSFW